MNQQPTFEIRRPRFQLPLVTGTIERRILVNFRCHPDALAKILPAPFRPKLISGWGMAGICLIRLAGIRPGFLPAALGLSSENAAHRIAVEWDEHDRTHEGVFIPRRDTGAVINRLAGGRLFPGVHHSATFRVLESGDSYKIEIGSRDGEVFVRVKARITERLPRNSIFRSLAVASEFFQAGALGWSARSAKDEFDGLELRCHKWRMAIERIIS